MDLSFFLKGTIIGVAITIPLGPIVLLCIQRTLSKGQLSGFISGMGSTTGDVFYAIIASLGVYAISHFLLEYQMLIRSIGCIVVILFGLKIIFSQQLEQPQQDHSTGGLTKDFLSILFLTLANPVAIALFPVLFASYDVKNIHSLNLLLLIFGMILGSAMWWFLLTCGVILLEKRIIKYLVFVNKLLGGLLVISGISIFIYILIDKIF